MAVNVYAPGESERLRPFGAPDRRTERRLSCRGVAQFRILPDGPRIVGTLHDLSPGGCCIVNQNGVPALSGAAVEVQMDVEDHRLRLAGVLRYEGQGSRAGIAFTEVSPRKQQQIEALLDELRMRETMASDTASD